MFIKKQKKYLEINLYLGESHISYVKNVEASVIFK